jgi:hypothetical protein
MISGSVATQFLLTIYVLAVEYIYVLVVELIVVTILESAAIQFFSMISMSTK